MKIDSLDHLVLTVADIDATCRFYCDVLGMEKQVFNGDRVAVAFGDQKINLHDAAHPVRPIALAATPGSADLCFLTATPINEVIATLTAAGVTVEQGPVLRAGATRQLHSVYVRDPDGNLVEISNQLPERE